VPISGFTGTVLIDFPNLPPGFTATGGNVAAGATVNFALQNTLPASTTVFQITVRGRFGTDVQSILLFVEPRAIPIQPPPQLKASVFSVQPGQLKPGDVVEGKLIGTNLGGITAVQASGSGIKVEVLEALPTELHVRFTVDANLDPGSRLLTLQAAGNKAGTTAIDVGAGSKTQRSPQNPNPEPGARPDLGKPGATDGSLDSLKAPDLVVGAQDFTMTPAHPKAGDTVLFHVVVRNSGTAAAEDAAIEFSIGGTAVRQREKVSIAPGARESFDFEWKAAGAGRLEPRVVIDPEGKLQQSSNSGKSAALQSFELAGQQAPRNDGVTAKSGDRGGMRQRGDLRLPVGGCTGFRLTSGSEQSCGGSADMEVSSQGATVMIEAEGVRSLGAVPLDQADGTSTDGLSSSASLVAGSTYLVRTRHGMAIVRVIQIRGIESVRNAPPAALRNPHMGGPDRSVQGSSGPADLTLVLEWKTLQQ